MSVCLQIPLAVALQKSTLVKLIPVQDAIRGVLTSSPTPMYPLSLLLGMFQVFYRFKSAPYLKPSSNFTHSDIVDAVQSAVDTALDAALGPFWDVNEKIDWFEINQR